MVGTTCWLAVDDSQDGNEAALVAASLGLPLLSTLVTSPAPAFLIQKIEGELTLRMTAARSPGPIKVDFSSATMQYRLRDALQHQAIARAIGIKPGLRPSVIDATAGLGRDGFLLASLGCAVTMVEADPVIFALLENGLQRAACANEEGVLETVSRIRLLRADSRLLLVSHERADVVYLDPMYASRSRTARAKKELYLLQQYFVHRPAVTDPDSGLLNAAIQNAIRRVVVKRPAHGDWLNDQPPHHSLAGTSSRYDIYLSA